MVTLTSADNALKSYYLGAITQQLNTEANPFLAKIKQSTADVWGKEVRRLAQYGVNGGVGAGTEEGALPAAGGNNLPGGEPAQQTFNEDAVRKRFKIVIIEDNMELADLLASEFSKLYHVTVAHDAEDGLEKIRKTLPDLIISDIMLPGMSGTELCRIVKNSMDTSHIPLVLLTAKSAVRYELEGLNAGADDYVTKPFDIYLLLARCNNLMNNRKLLQERYFSRSDTASQMVAMTPLDYELMDKATSFVLANIENDEVFARSGKQVWYCSNCGYLHYGEKAPEVCPVCSHPKAYFQLRAENY